MSLQAEKLISRLTAEGIPVCSLATNPALPRGLAWVGSVPGLRTLIRELQFLFALLETWHGCDIVHHFSASGLYFFAHSAPLLFLGRLSKKRVILNYRGGHASKFFDAWNWCAIPLIRLASAVCVPSEFLQKVFGDLGVSASILPNIAETDELRWDLRDRFQPKLLITRHLDPMYNTECALRAFRTVKQCCPEATFTVAGDGSEANRLRTLASEWKLTGLRFLGAVPSSDLPALYAAHDIYLNSSNVDNFPGALVEAACCGLPIVTTGAGGIPWMIRNRESGIVVNLDDDEALAAAVIEIVEHPELGRRFARNARLWAEQFSWQNVLPRLLKVYGAPSAQPKSHIPEAQVLTP
jgi:glycosyltransferase involved in cell wall biosynthesis